MKHLELGKQGEDLAAQYLAEQGYRVVERNYRAGRGEIDLIAWWGDRLLVFFEVKTRTHDSFGGPEEAVNKSKRKWMAKTAGWYMEQIGYDWEIRFDIVAIILNGDKPAEIRHTRDAFFPYE